MEEVRVPALWLIESGRDLETATARAVEALEELAARLSPTDVFTAPAAALAARLARRLPPEHRMRRASR